jgi:hypothetical protein
MALSDFAPIGRLFSGIDVLVSLILVGLRVIQTTHPVPILDPPELYRWLNRSWRDSGGERAVVRGRHRFVRKIIRRDAGWVQAGLHVDDLRLLQAL